MIRIIFEPHSTSKDNESERASGWNDVDLSPRGIQEAKELGQRYAKNLPDMVFCSDLQRSYKTTVLAFHGKSVPIITDERLRECNYGDMTQAPNDQIKNEKLNRIIKPFPNGESYTQTTERMKDFLKDLLNKYDDKQILIIGHRATHYGLDYLINGMPLEELTTKHWKWQPGWHYDFESLKLV